MEYAGDGSLFDLISDTIENITIWAGDNVILVVLIMLGIGAGLFTLLRGRGPR